MNSWRKELECEECRRWTGKPPVPLKQASEFLKARGVRDFKLSHACHLRVAGDGSTEHIPSTVLELPDGTTTQWIPELP